MSSFHSDKSLHNQEGYEEVILCNGFDKVIQDEFQSYNKVARARASSSGYFYSTEDNNLYMNKHMTGSGGSGYAPVCLIDYHSYENQLRFKSAVSKKEWLTIYKYTKFLINDGKNKAWFSFQFLPKQEHYLSRIFTIISAENPNMQLQSNQLNKANNVSMQNILHEKGVEFYDSMGELSGHEEKSFIVYDLDKKEAISLGKQFGQESILFNDGEFISIINCKTQKIELELKYNKFYGKKTRLDKDKISNNLSQTANDVISVLEEDNIICPLPTFWTKVWKLLPKRKQYADKSWNIPLPLILSTGLHSSDEEKKQRFKEHLEYAEEHNKLDDIIIYLNTLKHDDWLINH